MRLLGESCPKTFSPLMVYEGRFGMEGASLEIMKEDHCSVLST